MYRPHGRKQQLCEPCRNDIHQQSYKKRKQMWENGIVGKLCLRNENGVLEK